jgi:hypothetical protein
VDLLKLGKFNCIFPDSLVLSDLSTLPFGSMKADTPLLADLAIKIPSSIDRKIAFEKC